MRAETDHENRRTRLTAGVLGCGDVARTRYLPYLTEYGQSVRIAACADTDSARAQALARSFRLQSLTPPDLLSDPRLDLIINLIPPLAHASTTEAALRAGKHVYSEKPFALSVTEGRRLQRTAAENGRRLASAPDTILGPNLQLARTLIDEGRIGTPFMAQASFVTADRSWHPNPEFFYGPGAGPVLDEGPYFISALVACLGPIASVQARAGTYRDPVVIQGGAAAGVSFRPQVPTSYVATLEFRSGVLATLFLSFDVRGSTLPPLEIYGEAGTIRPGFPGFYNGPVLFGRRHDDITERIETSWSTEIEDARGIGVDEFAESIVRGTPSRLEGEFPLHVLECMTTIIESAASRQEVRLKTDTGRPPPFEPQKP